MDGRGDEEPARKLRALIGIDDRLIGRNTFGNKAEGEVPALFGVFDRHAEPFKFKKDIHRAALHLIGAFKAIISPRKREDDGQKTRRRTCAHHVEGGVLFGKLPAASFDRDAVLFPPHLNAERLKAGKQGARIFRKGTARQMHVAFRKRGKQQCAVEDTLRSGHIRFHVVRVKSF